MHAVIGSVDAALGEWRAGMAAAEQARKTFGMDHASITELAEQEEPGCEGVNFLPYLTGERTPNWPSSYGVLTGLRPGQIRPGLLYRAALEGATFSLLNGQCPPPAHPAPACHKAARR